MYGRKAKTRASHARPGANFDSIGCPSHFPFQRPWEALVFQQNAEHREVFPCFNALISSSFNTRIPSPLNTLTLEQKFSLLQIHKKDIDGQKSAYWLDCFMCLAPLRLIRSTLWHILSQDCRPSLANACRRLRAVIKKRWCAP
jgi:hypothetical protein